MSDITPRGRTRGTGKWPRRRHCLGRPVAAAACGRGDRIIARRTLLAGAVLGVLIAPFGVLGQPRRRLPHVAILSNNTPTAELSGPEPVDRNIRAFLRGLRELGWVDGHDLVVERASAEGRPERVSAIVREAVERRVDVLVTYGPAMAKAARAATTTIPVVAISGDLVGQGLVGSLARPGGNVTGLTLEAGLALNGKRLDLLKQLLPRAQRIAFLRPGPLPGRPLWRAETEAAAKALGLTLVVAAVDAPEDLDAAFAAIAHDRPDGIHCPDTPVLLGQRQRIVDFAARERLPAIYALRAFVESGGLMSYGTDLPDVSRRAATYVDKILKGARPADLPVEQPTKFELVISLTTAKALRLTIPPALLARADEVIQ